MPAYNEGETIAGTVDEIGKKIIPSLPNAKLMIFEDGSPDNTRDVMKALSRKYSWVVPYNYKNRMGYPKAVKNAFSMVDDKKFPYVLFMDADGQYDPDDCLRLCETAIATGTDMVVAERKNRSEPLYRVLLSQGLHLIEHLLFRVEYEDVTSACRVIKSKIAKQIAKEVKFSKYNFWLEFTARASTKNLKIKIVDVNYRQREGESRVYSMGRMPKVVINELGALLKTKFGG
ncbi:MAG: glycosyltransferase family 2 protein [Candidatus Micrarchaeota archaeon]|nr:glycosyltransferase family 2 protein [Candidatus Micrarchaeota archaeon]